MNQEKIGKIILNLRKKNNLTQKEFADKFGVTYQAVSKWENGKNIPDLAIIKQICEEYDISIEEILDLKLKDKKKSKKKYIIIVIILIIIVSFSLLILFQIKKSNFEFKTLETTCDDFNISGSIAYNDNKSSIYISDIEYCGETDKTKYKKIECSLYDIDDNQAIKIDECASVTNEDITLNEYLTNISFNIDNYQAICKTYTTNYLQLEIQATDENNKTISYKIPLTLKDNCKQ